MSNLVKSLEHIKSFRLRAIKSLSKSAILSDVTVSRSAVEQEKKATYLRVIKKPKTYKFFKELLTTESRLIESWFLTADLFPNILKYRNHRSGHMLKKSANINASSNSQLF